MARPKGRNPSERPTIAIGVQVSRIIIEYPLIGPATMKVYGRSAALKPGQADLSSVMIEETLDPRVGVAVQDLLKPHLLQKLAAEGEGEADGQDE